MKTYTAFTATLLFAVGMPFGIHIPLQSAQTNRNVETTARERNAFRIHIEGDDIDTQSQICRDPGR